MRIFTPLLQSRQRISLSLAEVRDKMTEWKRSSFVQNPSEAIRTMMTLIKNQTAKNQTAIVLAAILSCVFAGDGWAQSGSNSGYGSTLVRNIQNTNNASRFSSSHLQNRVKSQSVLRPGVTGINRKNFLGSSSSSLTRPSKPFSGVSQGPTVSPYLALSSLQSSGSDYQTIIRPQQQKQRENQRAQAFAIRRQHQLNQTAARAPYSATGDANSAPTGHAAVFQSLGSYQNTGNYFQPPSRPKQQR